MQACMQCVLLLPGVERRRINMPDEGVYAMRPPLARGGKGRARWCFCLYAHANNCT
jgi:hypothetical protein